jgi:isopenicillin N synthase-like dioxygenase
MTYTTLELATAEGPQYRQVSTAPPRKPTAEEIPIIDLSNLDDDYASRAAIAAKVKVAAENTGFFYVKNHGISESMISSALDRVKTFFDQTPEEKEEILFSRCGRAGGYNGVGSTQINKTETAGMYNPPRSQDEGVLTKRADRKETFSMRYDGRNDVSSSDPALPDDLLLADNDRVWSKTSKVHDFKSTLIEFWQVRLQLARKMIRIFALALDLTEDYFDAATTHPGADAVFIHYPGVQSQDPDKIDVGLGAHTDIQCLTLLWQDMSGGLQVLSADSEWLDAAPIEGTLVVNIGDLLSRLSNNKFKSTVHRVYNRQKASRYAMPFFLGFNPEAMCSVVPTCIDEDHPALYPPIASGQVSEVKSDDDSSLLTLS